MIYGRFLRINIPTIAIAKIIAIAEATMYVIKSEVVKKLEGQL